MSDAWARYSPDPSGDSGLPMHCVGAGSFRGAAGGFRGRRLRSYGAVVVTEGSGRYFPSRGARAIAVEAPALMWLFPGTEHGYGPGRSGWQEHWMLFGGPAAPMLERAARWPRSAPVVALDAVPPMLEATFSTLRAAVGGDKSTDPLRASAACYSFVSGLSADIASSEGSDVVERFGENSVLRMTMAGRAAALDLDVPALRRIILQATGVTPVQFLIEQRLARSLALLAETDLDVSAIAGRVGFDDPAYFSRQFTKRRGESPSAFRRLHRRGDAS